MGFFTLRPFETGLRINGIRLFINSASSSTAAVSEIQIRTTQDGPSITVGGTASASSLGSGSSASRAFDGSAVNSNVAATAWISATGGAANSWIRYMFPSPIQLDSIVEFAFTTQGGAGGVPNDYIWQYTTDSGSTWVDIVSDLLPPLPLSSSLSNTVWYTTLAKPKVTLDHYRYSNSMQLSSLLEGNTRMTGYVSIAAGGILGPTVTKTSGIWQYEMTVNQLPNSTLSIGWFDPSTFPRNYVSVSSAGSWGIVFSTSSGGPTAFSLYSNGVSFGLVANPASSPMYFGVGSIFTFVWDVDNSKGWLWIDGNYAGEIYNNIPQNLFPAFGFGNGNGLTPGDLSINFGDKPFSMALQKNALPYYSNSLVSYPINLDSYEIWRLVFPIQSFISVNEWRIKDVNGTNFLINGECTGRRWIDSTTMPTSLVDGNSSTYFLANNTLGDLFVEYRTAANVTNEAKSMEIVGTDGTRRPNSYTLLKSIDDGRTFTQISAGNLTYIGNPGTATIVI